LFCYFCYRKKFGATRRSGRSRSNGSKRHARDPRAADELLTTQIDNTQSAGPPTRRQRLRRRRKKKEVRNRRGLLPWPC